MKAVQKMEQTKKKSHKIHAAYMSTYMYFTSALELAIQQGSLYKQHNIYGLDISQLECKQKASMPLT